MIMLIGSNMQSTLCFNAIKHVKLKQHCHFLKSVFAKVHVSRKLLSYYNHTIVVNIKQFQLLQFKCFRAIQNFLLTSQLSTSHKLISESNEECLVKRNSSLDFQIHFEGRSRVTMQGRLCYVTMLNYCMVTACWHSLNDYLPPCTSSHIQETNGLNSCQCLSHVSAFLFAFSLSHLLNSRKVQLEAKSNLACSPPISINHTQELLAAMVHMEWKNLFVTDDGMSLTWRR